MNTALRAAAGLLAFGASTAASAINFVFDNANSSVSVVGTPTCAFGSCSLTAQLLTPFNNRTIAAGSSQVFDFARFTISGGMGGDADAQVSAKLAFINPAVPAATSGGTAGYLTIFGRVSAGRLTWGDGAGTSYSMADGTAFNVDFVDLGAGGFGNSAMSQVRITAISEGRPVIHMPEPGTWALMAIGFGMVGAAVRRRRPLAA